MAGDIFLPPLHVKEILWEAGHVSNKYNGQCRLQTFISRNSGFIYGNVVTQQNFWKSGGCIQNSYYETINMGLLENSQNFTVHDAAEPENCKLTNISVNCFVLFHNNLFHRFNLLYFDCIKLKLLWLLLFIYIYIFINILFILCFIL